MQEGVEEMNTKSLLFHHQDNSMSVMDIEWVWVPVPGYWVRDETHEALKALREAGMLTEVTEEELPF